MKKRTKKIIDFNDQLESMDLLYSFEDIKTCGSEAKFILSGVTLRHIQY